MVSISAILALLTLAGILTISSTAWFFYRLVATINDPVNIELMAIGYTPEQAALAEQISGLEQELEVLLELPGAEYSIANMKALIDSKRVELTQLLAQD